MYYSSQFNVLDLILALTGIFFRDPDHHVHDIQMQCAWISTVGKGNLFLYLISSEPCHEDICGVEVWLHHS
jgi:hypothetical protein